MGWTAVVWNMHNQASSWDALAELPYDVALLNEAPLPFPEGARGVFEGGGTLGRDAATRRRHWTTAVLSPHDAREIEDAQAVSYRGRRPAVQFGTARPGSWTAGTVTVPDVGEVTCVSIYGLLDELSEASVHRSLSEISPLFSDPRYKDLLILGGDLNTGTQWPHGGHLDGDMAILQRIKGYGLVDCLDAKREPGRLEGCRCTYGDECRHTWTRLDPSHPEMRLQVDYLFASAAIGEWLTSCEALPPPDWARYSDHSPIIATFG
jgi:hypothetical protein